MESTIKQRIKQFCNEIGISVKAFEEHSNLSNGYVNGISKSIGDEKLKTISLSFPQLNITWLLTGDGEMLNSEGCQSSSGETITMSREAWQTIVSQQETIRSQQEDLSRLIAAMLGKIDEQPKKAAASL